jgi:hypothetical protein
MASVNYTNPIADMHGKLAKTDKVVFRTRNGVKHAYAIKHPHDDNWSDKQIAARASFADVANQVKNIYADPEQLASWRARFEQLIATRAYRKQLEQYLAQQNAPAPVPYIPQPKLPKPPTTLYGFIFSSLSK